VVVDAFFGDRPEVILDDFRILLSDVIIYTVRRNAKKERRTKGEKEKKRKKNETKKKDE
jgi:hypothetical protein